MERVGLSLLLGVSAGLLTLAACVGDDPPAASALCTPHQSLACIGPGGCAGGQTCNARGSAFGDCVCGAAGAASTDASMASDTSSSDASVPQRASLSVALTMKTADRQPISCDAVGNGIHFALELKQGASAVATKDVACDVGQVALGEFPVGMYSLSVEAFDDAASIGHALTDPLVLNGTDCDVVVGDVCQKTVSVVVVLD